MTTFASDGTTQPTSDDKPDPVAEAPVVAPESEPETVEQPKRDGDGEIEVVIDEAPKWEHQSTWAHDWLEFKGDKLAIRVPKGAALQCLYFARHSSPEFQDELVGRFMALHVSPESYERVMTRMVDPDETEYGTDVWTELMKAIAEIGGERAKKEAEALAEVANGKASKGK